MGVLLIDVTTIIWFLRMDLVCQDRSGRNNKNFACKQWANHKNGVVCYPLELMQFQ